MRLCTLTNFQQLDVTSFDIRSIPTRGKGRTWHDAQHDARCLSCPPNQKFRHHSIMYHYPGTLGEEQKETRILSLDDLLIDTTRPSKGGRSSTASEHQRVLTLDDLSAISEGRFATLSRRNRTIAKLKSGLSVAQNNLTLRRESQNPALCMSPRSNIQTTVPPFRRL